ncbi:hypothetical protein [Flavobacterium psychrotrophum]|uniref:hypothetical protein n=1 Tax=Flavobacterium psychrotrophum TaxID=2294119 RepID=UPI000E31E5E3|nr:hypothetical protein [Flavobacterium psychrotrophum]
MSNLNVHLYKVYEKHPELKFDGANGDYVADVIKIACEKINSSKKRDLVACNAYVKKWKPRIIENTIFYGLIGGITGGFIGAWGGAVGGFANAGWSLVDCLEAAGC